MKLKTYLSENKLSHEAFAKIIGASEFGVRKWTRGERIPRPRTMQKIEQATDGAVSLPDWTGVQNEPVTEPDHKPPHRAAS